MSTMPTYIIGYSILNFGPSLSPCITNGCVSLGQNSQQMTDGVNANTLQAIMCADTDI